MDLQSAVISEYVTSGGSCFEKARNNQKPDEAGRLSPRRFDTGLLSWRILSNCLIYLRVRCDRSNHCK